ncbi:hypothetical protein [Streptomyces sp. NPDC048481]|uniref:hypothetical protein n=1 Tax=Streptomyces sp. NPDC048481 TaxID=3365557 RepID=UPI00371BA76C
MTEHEQQQHDDGQERPRTALEEVLREIEDAETHPDEPDGEDHGHGSGEAADALTTNRRAQEESEGD